LARGQRWPRIIEADEVSSLREIGQRDGADHRYVTKHLNLTFLGPEIVAAILDNLLPDGRAAQRSGDQPDGCCGRISGRRLERRLRRLGRGGQAEGGGWVGVWCSLKGARTETGGLRYV
jgi:hypothetical protein